MLSCGMNCYHVGWNVIMWDQMLSCGVECYHVGSMLSCGGRILSCGVDNHVGSNVIMWGSNVIMWDQCYHVGVRCYHVGSMLSYGGRMLSCGMECGIKCYHVMLSWGMITPPPILFFLKTSQTRLWRPLEVKEVFVYFFQHFCIYSKAVRFHYAEGLYRKETRSRLHEHTVHWTISLMFLDII